jgi:phosphocarrier protein HPr
MLVQRELMICNKLGLHARASSKFTQLASTFSNFDVWLVRHEDNHGRKGLRVNAKSIMGVMMLAAGRGTSLTLEIHSRDNIFSDDMIPEMNRAADALEDLVARRFDEAE